MARSMSSRWRSRAAPRITAASPGAPGC
jgi:hypothetical protein